MDSEIYGRYEIIDAHAHIFPEKIAENATANTGKFYDLPMRSCGTSTKLIEGGSEIGVSRYLICSTATKPEQVASINSFIAGECAAHPCFFGFGTAHPDSADITADINQVRELGLHGIKLHPDFQTFDMDSEGAYKIYEQIEGIMPVLIHCGDSRFEYSAPKKIANIHRDFPKLMIFAAHLGGYERWDEAAEYLTGLENVKFDTSSSLFFMPAERAAKMIRSYGVENCFFGSDFPMWSHADELERLLALGFTEEENQRILAGNFKECMRIK
ncbi:MAG: amidohydrolase family protein [Ruminococcus sp.]|nr:amidohydrolase family protein [Ruminococcus sp.]